MKLLTSLTREVASLHRTIEEQKQYIKQLEGAVEQKDEEIAALKARTKSLQHLNGLPGGSNPQHQSLVTPKSYTPTRPLPASSLRPFMRQRGPSASCPVKLTAPPSPPTRHTFQVRGPYGCKGLPYHYIDGLLSAPARDDWGNLLETLQGTESIPDPATLDENENAACPPEPDTPVLITSRPAPPADSSTYKNWVKEEPGLALCFGNHAMAFDYARLALDLGKEALWHYAKARHPELWERLSPISPTFIRACWGELNQVTLGWKLAPEIKCELEDFSQLRNFVAHPDPPEALAAYDKVVRLAEALILRIGDEARLGKLREARQALRAEAVTMAADIETRGALAQLQAGHIEESSVWDPPHIDLFKRLLFLPEYQRVDPHAVHPVVLRIAEGWGTINAVGEKEDEPPVVTTLDIRYPPSW
ncbi:uncharacterized protein B0H64DRAFT_440905 [Chaetomium fimeti]|uniref:Uncharacterized protein n=1 Tax=Chaetomium fimeti TaxID=1854472 RepID=A0AAE0HKR6_9PEZI|nr:hypothetical protein B0H64DRAFT_440905 [Chaetomium fimeti]